MKSSPWTVVPLQRSPAPRSQAADPERGARARAAQMLPGDHVRLAPPSAAPGFDSPASEASLQLALADYMAAHPGKLSMGSKVGAFVHQKLGVPARTAAPPAPWPDLFGSQPTGSRQQCGSDSPIFRYSQRRVARTQAAALGSYTLTLNASVSPGGRAQRACWARSSARATPSSSWSTTATTWCSRAGRRPPRPPPRSTPAPPCAHHMLRLFVCDIVAGGDNNHATAHAQSVHLSRQRPAPSTSGVGALQRNRASPVIGMQCAALAPEPCANVDVSGGGGTARRPQHAMNLLGTAPALPHSERMRGWQADGGAAAGARPEAAGPPAGAPAKDAAGLPNGAPAGAPAANGAAARPAGGGSIAEQAPPRR